jgi:hypothetical protein
MDAQQFDDLVKQNCLKRGRKRCQKLLAGVA